MMTSATPHAIAITATASTLALGVGTFLVFYSTSNSSDLVINAYDADRADGHGALLFGEENKSLQDAEDLAQTEWDKLLQQFGWDGGWPEGAEDTAVPAAIWAPQPSP